MMDVELIGKDGTVVRGTLDFYGDVDVVDESGESVSVKISALLLLGYTIRKATPVSGAVRLQEGSQV